MPPIKTLLDLESAPTLEVEAVRLLMEEYLRALPIDISYQGVDVELRHLPARYAPPAGNLWLACHEGAPAGCIAVRPLGNGRCEAKRLYVRPAHRGVGLGRDLLNAAIDWASGAGYTALVVDTLPALAEANALYRALGFAPIPPFHETPVKETLFFQRDLSAGAAGRAPSLPPPDGS